MQPKNQLKFQYIGIFEEIDFLLTKNALLKRGPKNLGMGRPPPPSFGQCPKENVFFSLIYLLTYLLTRTFHNTQFP